MQRPARDGSSMLVETDRAWICNRLSGASTKRANGASVVCGVKELDSPQKIINEKETHGGWRGVRGTQVMFSLVTVQSI